MIHRCPYAATGSSLISGAELSGLFSPPEASSPSEMRTTRSPARIHITYNFQESKTCTCRRPSSGLHCAIRPLTTGCLAHQPISLPLQQTQMLLHPICSFSRISVQLHDTVSEDEGGQTQNKHLLAHNTPASIWSPLVTATWRTVPLRGDETLVSIFIADKITRGWPAFTVAPAQHSTHAPVSSACTTCKGSPQCLHLCQFLHTKRTPWRE